MPKLKTQHISPTPAEDQTINAGIAADKDARELNAAWFTKSKPASQAFAPDTYDALLSIKRPHTVVPSRGAKG